MSTSPLPLDIPHGFVLTKKGGRPRKEARDAAIFLAMRWRTLQGDSATRAEAWVVEHWERMGTEAARGIGETAHVRAAARRARRRGLADAAISRIGRALIAFEVGPHNGVWGVGVRAWGWCEGMEIAAESSISKFSVSYEPAGPEPLSGQG